MKAADTRPRSSRRRQHRTMRTEAPSDGDMDFLRTGGSVPSENNKQAQKKPLNFYKAMSDFQTMFPHIDKDVIEAVLRANDGVVQTTIDQLLVLSETTEEDDQTTDVSHLPGYHESQNQDQELPPSYAEVENEILTEYTRECLEFESRRQSSVSPVFDVSSNNREERTSMWNPPLVGPLPHDFLRLDEQPLNDVQDGPSAPTRGMAEANRDGFISDRELEQFLEDEKLAMFLQNEEFMRQLRHDPDFLLSLDEDYKRFERSQGNLNGASHEQIPRGATAHPGGARPRNSSASYDDATFNRKLKHMGKTTRKKFGKLAKRFSRKKNPKFVPLGASTANLLEEESDDDVAENPMLGGIQEHASDDENYEQRQVPATKESTGRRLPQPPSGHRSPANAEPIVFYSEDNEFEYKND